MRFRNWPVGGAHACSVVRMSVTCNVRLRKGALDITARRIISAVLLQLLKLLQNGKNEMQTSESAISISRKIILRILWSALRNLMPAALNRVSEKSEIFDRFS